MEKFLEDIPFPGLYGLQGATLSSLVLAHVKMKEEDSMTVADCATVSPGGTSVLSALECYCTKEHNAAVSV